MKRNYEMRIKLLSDLCVSDGGVYNSFIDIDVCYDEYGLPYIPAKRMKGCLRECALELNDWGCEVDIAALFGSGGETKSSVKIENAYLENMNLYKKEINAGKGHILVHPQNILRNFTYLRSQTSIDYVSGVAEENSLRCSRVIKKGLEFVAKVQLEEKFYNDFAQCCTVWKHMGIARTRGMGEIQVTLEKKQESSFELEHSEWKEGSNKIVYELELLEPVICKSVNGQEENTLDYIEGAKVLGIFAQAIKEKESAEAFLEVLDAGEINFSNAYLCEEGRRFLEVPGTYYSIKNNDELYLDYAYNEAGKKEDGIQPNQMKHCYVAKNEEGKLIKKDVLVEERYHHSRPEDKGIGRAYVSENSNSKFYQMSSIMAGQTFQGFIQGTSQQIKRVYDVLKEKEIVQIGSGNSAEYGKVKFRMVDVKASSEKTIYGKRFMVTLLSPAIVYNDNATYTTQVNDFIEEMKWELGIEKEVLKVTQCFLKYTEIGGFQVTWKKRKPTIEAFDKGTVIIFELKEAKELKVKECYWLGERVQEGFGEMKIEVLEEGNRKQKIYKEENSKDKVALDISTMEFLPQIATSLFDEFVEMKAAKRAKEIIDKNKDWKSSVECKATINNMLLMCKERESLQEVKKDVMDRFSDKNSEKKGKKHKIAITILEEVKKSCSDSDSSLIKDFKDNYNIAKMTINEEEIKKNYLYYILLELKYVLRKGEKSNE